MMTLHWYQWTALVALGICLAACLVHFIRLLRTGKPADFSRQNGETGGAIRYAFTGAMSPVRKESAYLHLPTYIAGLFYHMGNFLSFFLFFFIISGYLPHGWIAIASIIFLSFSSISGISILLKRIIKKELRSLSNPDDFISNTLVTSFQIFTIFILLSNNPGILQPYILTVLPSYSYTILPSYRHIVLPSYYIIFTLLVLYIPVGKLRHAVYFFAARYHLGYFFGWRGVWPPGNVNK